MERGDPLAKPGPAFTIDRLENHPDSVSFIADERWQAWGYGSRAAAVSDIRRSTSDGLPVRLVAIARTEPIGIVNLIDSNLPTHRHLSPWLAGLYVWPEYRSRGVGSELCRRLEDDAMRLGFDRLYLYTEEARGFYERLGWSAFETSLWEGNAITIMSKLIRSGQSADSRSGASGEASGP